MLKQVGQYNDLSPALLKKLEEKINSFGNVVLYRFDIENENPDKTYYNGKTIFPGRYTLDPAVFTITDTEETRPEKSKTKTVALIKSYDYKDEIKGYKAEFNKVRVSAPARGILRLDLTTDEDKETCFYMELHPKLSGGMFFDKSRIAVVSRIDEEKEATKATQDRAEKRKALNAVADMSYSDLQNFADGMGWDSTRKESVIRNDAEELSETDPKYFNDIIGSKKLEFLTLVKQAIDREIITYDPAEHKFSWAGNKQIITTVSPMGDKSDNDKLAEWLLTAGAATATKIKSLVADKKSAVA